MLQSHDFGAGEVFLQLGHVFNPGAAPAVDRLVVITDGHDLAMGQREAFQPAVLNGVAVLKLIHQNMLKSLLVVLAKRLVLLEQFQGA